MKRVLGRHFFIHTLYIAFVCFLVSTAIVHAEQSLSGIIYRLINLIQTALPVIMALAFLYFLWGGAQLIFSMGDENGRKAGKATLLWGGIALFIMVTVWSLVAIIAKTFFAS